jgi:hypothetical protein
MKFWLTYLGFALMMGGVLILLSGCNGSDSEEHLYKMVPPPELESSIEHPEEESEKEEEAVGNRGPSLCYPCFGPHLRMDGTIGIMPSFSPGLSLY